MGKIVTFYSYKGGVGRTMAVANTAIVLANFKHRVLIVDWDLEAPGLESFFSRFLNVEAVRKRGGVVDLLTGFSGSAAKEWSDRWEKYVVEVRFGDAAEPLSLLTSGRRDDAYFQKVRSLDVAAFYENEGGHYIEQLRRQWLHQYDFVLIDSRTGITDIGGICTVHLPDILALLFTGTEQSLTGILDVAAKARRARKRLPFDRASLKCLPVASRIDAKEEFKTYQEWLGRVSPQLESLTADWLPLSVGARKLLETFRLAYIPYFSFGEKLPVLEQGTDDVSGLGYGYESLGALLANNLAYAQRFVDDRTAYIRAAVKGRSIAETGAHDPSSFLRDLLDNAAHIDIRGLSVGTGKSHRFPIEDLYISLTTTLAPARLKHPRGGTQQRPDEEEDLSVRGGGNVPLHAALENDRLVVIGDPGAGKTTFLRRIAHALCQTRLGEVPKAAEQRLGIRDRTFPVFVRIHELAEHVKRSAHAAGAPGGEAAAAWLPHYLGAAGAAASWGLDGQFFHQELAGGACTVLLDGLDEAPDRRVREQMTRLISNATTAYQDCRFVVTSRPAAYVGEVILPQFAHARIDPLSDEAVDTFLRRWCMALYNESCGAAHKHLQELLAAVRGRAEIRRMARNPVMLTALAVVHWNERRLPEQRADLYDSILTWLSRSREQRPGRATADRTVVLLQELALAMQDDPEGRKTQVPKRWAAERLADELGGGQITKDTVAAAERFLDEEEVDSGIIVGRGNEVAYWHLTFQEFLAAKAIASRLDDEQRRILFADPDKVYLPDWREVVLLLSGALHQQGKAKAAGFLAGLLDGLGPAPSLADQARCAGLIGSILQDLVPLNYEFPDARYHALLDAVTAIFDPQRWQTVPLAERIAAADALGQAGDARLDLRRDDYWVTIPAGKFLMGTQSENPHGPNYDPEAISTGEWRETPHEVYLDAYRIARYPLTVGQYRQFVDDEGYQNERWWQAGGFGEYAAPDGWDEQLTHPSRPVVNVSWWEAMAFCAWAGVRLPTEAEWERAARGSAGRKYPWGEDPINEQRANYARALGQPNVGHSTPVGIYPPGNTPEWICDLAGNVWEWCEDGSGEYTGNSVSNPHGAPGGAYRVFRGGSWNGHGSFCRAAVRSGTGPSNRSMNVGFRLARSVSLP